ncbi:Long-chain-fatty-acid--CoA ligase [Patulibacter medicamentivorans]|uniref:Long-chain-fatty-acid--CoA ligase n=1 Tax=Patulibacter medicamentivorans TaxID=1097667 RepID=H0E5N6_9ACTN|nr:MlaD family protein [Patulibacter medicamentivorans]EHN10999.1 Long-chain-fatty-acid--CoA ligase [Patulibacter medicamentivorans]
MRRIGRRAAGRRTSRFSVLAIGLAAIAVLSLMAWVGYRAADTVPGREYYNLKAEFDGADNLANHYEVRIGGLRAGQILRPRVKDGKALVDLRLDKKFAPLRSDTQLRIRLRSAVGVRYLEMIPGTKGRPLPEGATIPAANARIPVALDDVLGTLDPRTRERTRTLLNELGAGAGGAGDQVNLALKELPPFLRDVQTLAEPLVAEPGITGRFVRSTASAAAGFDAVRDTMAAGFEPERAALKPFADNADALGETLDEATPTLNQLQAQLPQVERLVAAVDGLARDGRPALRVAPAALRQTTALMRGSRPALRQARETLDKARDAVDPTVGLLTDLVPQAPRIERALGDITPTLRSVAPRACELSNAMTGWSEFMKWGNTTSNFIRFQVTFNPGDILGGATATRQGPDGKPLLSQFVHTNPYPGPCVNGEGEAGKQMPRVEESMKGLTYSKSFQAIR